MRAIESRLRRLERGTDKPISLLRLDQQSEAELQAVIAERKAKGFRVFVVGWKTQEKRLRSLMSAFGGKADVR